ncbi:Uncharacterised protein [Moraxella lacunata]|uniref:Uncharacterized protein n=1 Tax=Moraxella lacunata TaxID=477 RepID=A0A378TQH0_MORLA|nr:hypothetical protein [Moraxella lacunata]STZ63095.1 Uncharacterised protein [Moraxella lacunata]
MPTPDPEKNCYCNLWQTDPDHLKKRNIPYGFCGICKCGEYGHLRHAPNGPYTAEFCDKCYRRLVVITYLKSALIVFLLIALLCKQWTVAGGLLVAIVILHGLQLAH